ncbi:MAG: hypothetical protein AAF633_20790, partial [Chloroflexota bacterium]
MSVSSREFRRLILALMMIAAILLGGIVFLLIPEEPVQAQDQPAPVSIMAVTPELPSSPWRFEANTDAWAVTSGDRLNLFLSFENFEADQKSPSLILRPPDGFRFDLSQLPSEANWSTASQEMRWQPTVSGFAQIQAQFKLDVVGTTLDNPDKVIVLDLALAGKREKFTLPVWAGSSPVASAHVWPEQIAVGQEVNLSAFAISEHPLIYT